MKTENLLIIVNCGKEKPKTQYAAYVQAFMAKKLRNVPNVTIFYGPDGVEMAKKGVLAEFSISPETKELIASQLKGVVSPSDLPDNLEELARFCVKELGITIASCATFHVLDGFAKTIDDTTQIEDFITPADLPTASEAVDTFKTFTLA
jgi:predicted peroxiredoxin